ncbi:MAG: TlpA family protein disulfide reductase [Chitinophagaceae bacterium]|nr:TlpA family protein disulfide reductase [Chitinophagaceae bacterium]
MKRLGLLFVLLYVVLTVVAQKPQATIELKVAGLEEGLVNVLLPVNHTIFWGAMRIDTIRGKKPLVIALNENQTGFVSIDVFNREIKLFIQKGDALRITIDEDYAENPVIIEGNNREGQLQLTKAELLYPGSLIMRYKNDTTAALLQKHVEEDKQVRLNVFKLLFEQRKIDKAFYDFVILTLDYYHASLISEVIAGKYAATTLEKDNPFYKPVFPADFGMLWEKIYKQYAVNNPLALQTFGYSDKFNTYAGDYISGYLGWQKNKQGGAPALLTDPAADMKEMFDRIQHNMQPAVAEFVQADLLYSSLRLEENYKTLGLLYNDFRRRYPQSAYTAFIQPLADKAIAYDKKVNQAFTPDQKIIPDYASVNSFRDLMLPFNGKTVYIEFWATWCITCKDQFDNEAELHQYLQSKGVEHLFVSVDVENKEAEWKELIKYFDLRGNHIKANERLTRDLSRIFWNGKGYALPLYVIIDAEGKIVEADALAPADRKKLYQQIGKYVK